MAMYRQARVGDEIKRILARAIQNELKDPRVPAFTSVTGVDVTRDFSYATCYISVLGTAEEQKKALEGLESSKGFLRSLVAKELRVHQTPELRFQLDTTYEEGQKIDRLIDQVMGKEKED
jgi:ribosome-binding factor A